MDLRFTAAGSELPMLYVFLGLASCELLVVHLLVSLWSIVAASILSLITLMFVIQVGLIVRRVKRRPTLVTPDALVVRSGTGTNISISWARIATVTGTGFGPAPSGPDVLQTAMIAHPNVQIILMTPIALRLRGRMRDVRTVALRVDDPDALIDAVRHALDRRTADATYPEADLVKGT